MMLTRLITGLSKDEAKRLIRKDKQKRQATKKRDKDLAKYERELRNRK